MHPSLVNFSWYTAMGILGTNDLSISFLQDVGLLPKKTHTLPCPKCGKEMKACTDQSRKMQWRFRCTKTPFCSGSMNPLENTFFKRANIDFNEILAIIFEFVRETPVTHTVKRISQWRKYRGEKPIDIKTVLENYNFCRNVCQIAASCMSVEASGTAKATESYYRANRLPKSLSEGELIHRFLEDIKSVFPSPCQKGPAENQSSIVAISADPSVNNKFPIILNVLSLCPHQNIVDSVETTTDLSFSNKLKPSLNKNASSPNIKRDSSILNEIRSYPCDSFVNSSENIRDCTLSMDKLSPEEDLVDCLVKNSCINLLNEDKSYKENIVNSPVNKKRCISVLNEDQL